MTLAAGEVPVRFMTAMACLALPLAAVASCDGERSWRIAAKAMLAAGLVTLAWTLSRGAWLGAVVAVATWVLAQARPLDPARRRRMWVLASAGIAVSLVATALIVPNAGSRIAAAARPGSGTTKAQRL